MTDAPADPRRTELASRFLVLALGGLFLLGLLGFIVAVLDARERSEAPAHPSLPGTTEESSQGGARIVLALAEPGPAAGQVLPVVPVARFWSTKEGLSRDAIVRALETGRLRGFDRVIVEDSVFESLAQALDVHVHANVARGDMAAVGRVIRRGGLGLLPATALGPSMRALRVDGRALTGNDRIADVTAWPLLIAASEESSSAWHQADTWVLVAGGDSFTDRGVYDTVVRRGKGVDYPFDGGTARVTGHACCDPVFGDNIVPRYVLTGNRGAVRRLFRDAELAIANHEMPTTQAWAFHRSGLRFSGRPDLTRIFSRAGIDYLSLANNHIKDYGADGISDTRRILREHGIAFGGAGVDLAQARRTRLLEAADARVAIIPCLGIVRAYWATAGESGATPCLDRYIVPDIKAARRSGADVVIVFPHWGVEYTRQPQPSMRRHAERWVKAGADLIVGAHSHVAGAIEDIGGSPVFYSLGNLVFDQHWSTNTMESALLEATFHGGTLIELRLRPYIIHDTSQPNLLDPARGEGRRLLRQVRAASAGWLDW